MSISISKAEAFAVAKAMDDIKATEKELSLAYYQAMGRAANFTAKRLAREIANRLEVPLKVMRKRLFMFKARQGKGIYKIWAGLNDLPLDALGKPTRLGADVVVKGVTASNAYITKAGFVRLRETKKRALWPIEKDAEALIQQLLPYYFYSYFEKEFKQLVKYKYGA